MAKKINSNSNSAETASSGVQLVKAIKNNLFKDVEIGVKIALAGIVRGVETKTSNLGEYDKFVGDFACKVGEQLTRANVMYVPSIAANLLRNGYLSALENAASDSKSVSVEFSFYLVKKEDEKSNVGYVWVVEPRHAPQPENDKVLQLLA